MTDSLSQGTAGAAAATGGDGFPSVAGGGTPSGAPDAAAAGATPGARDPEGRTPHGRDPEASAPGEPESEPGPRPVEAVEPPAMMPEPPVLVITGVVRDSLGVLLPRAVVTLAVPGEGGRQLAKTRSAADGVFSVTAPGRADYLLCASAPQLGEERLLLRLEDHSVEVEFRVPVPGAVAD
ncbi:carboxypeptidase-like regulatory domain-containing protein [Streptomyces bohaiensis]|uniref:carboxypeptidase-like regulatory domain-containing protein n=1 Tax=Streptomyces bohaiensis TaxID=1431344 RepID=UPI003B7E8DFE